jgi:hypothetical protein
MTMLVQQFWNLWVKEGNSEITADNRFYAVQIYFEVI